MLNLTILLLFILSSTTYSHPATPSFIVATPGPEPSTDTVVEPLRPGLVIYKLHVTSNVTNRFAHTLINSKVKNYEANAAEATFSVIIPETAYISGFLLEVDGKRYDAHVKEKEEAKNIYNQAVSGGRSAAHVAAARDSSRFEISVNIASGKKASFYMTYEELLQRSENHYEIIININPGQPVKDLRAEVNIQESKPLRFVKAPPIRSGNSLVQPNDTHLDPRATVFHINNTTSSVVFKPNIRRQKQLAHNLGTNENFGLSGQFIVQYDVVRDDPGGEILLQDGYFVHFYAPPDLPPLPKQVVFVLDTSGSMDGTKLEQLKAAMYTVLQELHENDTFSFVEFESVIRVWNLDQTSVTVDWSADLQNLHQLQLPPSFPVNKDNLEKAWLIVDGFKSQTSTNIYTALIVALKIVELEETKNKANYLQPLIIFLTDGEPTEGITDTARIIKDITSANKFHTPIYTLSFGDGADRKFLQTLSLKNKAFSRHIYESADASLQLEDFYRHISSPLLTNVKFKYTSNVTDLTRSEFPVLYGGSEVVITGKTDGELNPTVEAKGYGGLIDVSPKISRPINQLERLWAYLTVKQLLEDKEIVEDNEKKILEEEALNLSLKFGLVTPVSSLIVEKPDGTDQTVEVVPADKVKVSPVFQQEENKSENSITTEVTTPASVNAAEKLQTDLPWLKNVMGLRNDTIVFSKGEFPLGVGISIPEGPFCLHTPLSSLPGMCQLLHECPDVHNLLTNVFIFKQYFCQLEGYAGVCCPY